MKIPYLCETNELSGLLGFGVIGTTNTCESFAGYSGVYRICFGFTIFHLFMAIILCRIRTANDCRNGIQNGFWFFKIIIIIGIIITNFLWPITKFNRGWKRRISVFNEKLLFSIIIYWYDRWVFIYFYSNDIFN
jgi:hypothetical protein